MFESIKMIVLIDKIFSLAAKGNFAGAISAISRAGYHSDAQLVAVNHGVEVVLLKRFIDREAYEPTTPAWTKLAVTEINRSSVYNKEEKEYLKRYALTLFSLDGGDITQFSSFEDFDRDKVRNGLKRKFPLPETP